ncbi:fused MFS/spermidine synthase [Corynebacterium pseudotuberculosis]|uniref:Transferase n=2 Tax=Corynebacterium pseudotuberculosis TaxID=1719 RepID=D9Q9W9_CORP2|nr:fused MFS/spermidine synthase [Corynebacterium pseudotuberculosis]AER68927.1 Spermidine synthase [Corynebacterium pseudotuberculosis 1/06-A]ADL10345.1 transferase [Corynebacterium pseudotuberculosis C231]ADO26137.1 methyltransferase domain-containing protein [Corynebacterium pseudotuberculosis I19]AEK92194.1 Spermidine synthase [Corynebacterium pseudotuberculosis PAT10]AEP70115.1 Spermidine synthase [Corynebacterium pseudotuberculosis 42/02-A]
MGRKKGGRVSPNLSANNGPVAGIYTTSTGTVELRPDSFMPHAWEVYVNGVPSSHICEDPSRLEYEYMRWIAAAVEWFVTTHASPTALRVTHLGGGACTMARYVAHLYPKSRNTVVELDGELARLARVWFDLPRAPLLKIRVGEAREVSNSFTDASRDVIIRDVFAGDSTPIPLTTVEFFRQCHRSLAPGGLYVANCGDHSDLRGARAELKGMAEVFTHVACISDPAMLKGRRYGNLILIGTDSPLPDLMATQKITRSLLGGGVPAQYKDDAWTRSFMASGIPRFDPPIA